MGTARNGDIDIAYEVEGPEDGVPLLLIMGLGLSMSFWPEGLRRELTEHGFRVARFDNRDVGSSTRLTGLGLPSPLVWVTRRWDGYSLADMAGDALAVLDDLGWGDAHIVGISLGGMIAQTLAGRHPERARTLTSISSTPAAHIGRPHPSVLPALIPLPMHDRDAAARRMVRIFRIIGSPGYPRDEQLIAEAARQSFDQGHDANGVRRQLAAILSGEDRRPLLRGLRMPVLVVHGTEDPLIRPAGGRATARAVSGAKLVEFTGMGHDLPDALFPAIAGEIADLASLRARRGSAT
ncbi:alpha/beta fold hydrolase [Actinoplanes sp. L3-i22]|uniref:alpha/beta fold hydrolase n=1 Tax=Actinoplanes sp. L3-i22 TaxID=2836373 RepID=UPI001C750D39|nr:alpha/beta hydrolase [Actinoplanes sp. L3-i22]BCY09417.1 alpha/beta hydrolase [Actinoplanes sp. L3-i22]